MSHAAWLRQAESDLEAAKVLSAASHHAQAVWLAAQAVEKGHKAILVALGLRYEEKHFKYLGHETLEIFNLLPLALSEPTDLQIAAKVETLEKRAMESRYPAPTPAATGPPQMTAPATRFVSSQQDIENAEALLEWCRQRIHRALSAVDAMAAQIEPSSP